MAEYLEQVVLNALDEIFGLGEVEEFTEYFKIYNPLATDRNTKSAVIYKEDFALKMFNSSIRLNGESKTILTLTQWLRLTKTISYYIYYICIKFNIPKSEFITYKSALSDFIFFGNQKYLSKNRFEYIRKTFYKSYIIDKDVFEIADEFEFKQEYKKPTIKKLESSIRFLQPNEFEQEKINEYRKERKIRDHKNISNEIILINDIYRKSGVCFNYGNGFKKIRIIHENKFRYFCSGKYEEFFEVRKNNSDECFIIEGEINSLSIQDYVDCDIFALHNVNSIPDSLKQIEKYKKIYIKLDIDKFNETKNLFIEKISNVLKDSIIIIDYVSEDNEMDYNELYKKNLLSKEVIYKINAII